MRYALGALLGFILGAAAFYFAMKPVEEVFEPDVESIAAASLDAVRAENRLSVFAGRFTVTVTSRAERLGFAAEKTMIVPATVRYELNYAELGPEDLSWNAEANELTVDLPDIEISEPEIDMSQVRDYGEGTVLLTIGGANESLDRANRRQVRGAVMEQARSELMLDLARESARGATARNFRLPLEAAGIPAQVRVRFPDERGSAM